jgi:hypothetical protein
MKLRLTLTFLSMALISIGLKPLAAQAAPFHMQSSSTSAPDCSSVLTFQPIAPHTLGDPPFRIAATSSHPGAVTYTVLGGPATLSHDVLTITGGGIVRLLAQQPGTSNCKAAVARTSFPVQTSTSEAIHFTQEGSVVKSKINSDTPNFLFLDSNGQFFLQNAVSQYDKVPANHVWEFYTGKNAQDPKLKLSKSNSQFDTQSLCESGSPVYHTLYSVPGITPGNGAFTDGNFCDVVGVWVDPDTGDWYGVVHNELYPNIPRIDVISYAISNDRGKTWTQNEPIATSPYGAANKKDPYYYYGEGDPRLVEDTSSGYFYLFYNSRIMKPNGKGFGTHEGEHVSRSRIRDKMAPSSWEKFDHGIWTHSPGIDWTCDPAGPTPCKPGSTATALASGIGADNDPAIRETFIPPTTKDPSADIAEYHNSTLHTASVSYDVYLKKYIAFAEDRDLQLKSGDYDDPTDKMSFYVSDDLAAETWTYAGSIPYRSASWYRWFVDGGNLTSSKTIGETFLAYCSIECSNPKNDSEYIKTAIALNPEATQPIYFSSAAGPGNTAHAYSIVHDAPQPSTAPGRQDAWEFVPVPDDGGFFNIRQGKKVLGVSGGNAGRAWGAKVRLSSLLSASHPSPEKSRQQWYFERIAATTQNATSAPHYRLINRYSGLALSFTGDHLAASQLISAVTAPIRDWDAARATVKTWRAADQDCVLIDRNVAAK